MLAGKDTRTLARALLAMTQEEFSAAFKGSPMKRAKMRGLKRNAAVVLGNIGDAGDVDVLRQAIDDPESLVREHAAWALDRIDSTAQCSATRERLGESTLAFREHSEPREHDIRDPR